MILTGSTAALFFQGARIGRCRSLTLQVEREALQTTKQGDTDRTYLAGLRGTSGSASLFYDPEDSVAVSLINKIYEDEAITYPIEIVFDLASEKKASASIVITNMSMSASFGAAQVCDIQFQVSGKPTIVF